MEILWHILLENSKNNQPHAYEQLPLYIEELPYIQENKQNLSEDPIFIINLYEE